MGNVAQNADALTQVLGQISPLLPRNLVQAHAGDGRTPTSWIAYGDALAPTTWTVMDVNGYAISFHPGDGHYGKRNPIAIGYVHFGNEAPPDASSINAGDHRVMHGSRIDVPQGFKRFWFRSLYASTGWQMEITKLPNVRTNSQPDESEALSVGGGKLDYADVEPSTASEGVALPTGHKTVALQLYTAAGGRLGVTVTAEVWWYNVVTGLWCHNQQDDFDSGGLQDADAGHDVEIFDVCAPFTRIYLRRTNSATGWTSYVASEV